jgi:uncharacterized membrane protein YheB (UPF0754 family)
MNQYGLFFAPFLGGLIGYFTNSIAVKMLFHPHKEIKLWRYVLPFTPGMIPKRQKDLARAMGKMVESNLLTLNDMQERLLQAEVKNNIIENLTEKVFFQTDQRTIKELILSVSDHTSYEGLKKNLNSYLCDRIVLAAADMDISDIVVQEGSQLIRNGLGGFLSMMISDSSIISLSNTLSEKLKQYIADHGREFIAPLLEDEIEIIADRNASEAIFSAGFSQERCRSIIESVYETIIRQNLNTFLQTLGIAGIVESKIAAMNIMELENLILSIMKTELETIVNLGALIGVVIGLLSMLF